MCAALPRELPYVACDEVRRLSCTDSERGSDALNNSLKLEVDDIIVSSDLVSKAVDRSARGLYCTC